MPKKVRGIKVDFWTDSKIVKLSPLARLLFIGSWHYSCDEGHVDSDPIELKMRVLPVDNCDVEELIEEIVEQGLFVREEGGLTVPHLREHQKPDRRWLLTCDRCEAPRGPAETTGEHASPRGDHASSRENTRGHARTRDEVDGDGEGEVKVKGVRGTRRRSATAAPAKIELSEADQKWAAEKCPDVDVAEATEEFLTWAKSVDKRYADWTAAWRNAMKRRQSWHDERAAAQPVKDNRPDWMLA